MEGGDENQSSVSLTLQPLRRVRRSRVQYEKLQRPANIQPGEVTPSIEGWTLILSNLDEDTTEMDINDLLCSFDPSDYLGNIIDIRVLLDAKAKCLGFALVELEGEEGFRRALNELNGKELLSKPIKVGPAFLADKDEPIEEEEKEGVTGEKRAHEEGESAEVEEKRTREDQIEE
ncbi:RNA-binding protein 8A [Angomonas deanei]|uniref:RNA recognition motif. (A.k.a. RRM, RBD, or RNP domain), putative n=1 Tax=Angomonas deanei TaxID=59799 RepID=A0A7G2CAS3_9TRYP|nr:RNA-binding protein 8A [Angomonas deanei]CAD2215853.1 RNA recognition motif. (a.k.a. RRM, RBD, or RNP domain), putative [Angomonas deanei]|eukprot:EPY40453.1 RNA-binding protein 8A [Angomonas deanei]